MRDGDHRPPLPHLQQAVLNVPLGLGIQSRGRLVQNQDRRVFQQGPRNADPLLFAARQLQPALADLGRIAVRQAHHEIMDLGRLGRGIHLVAAGIRVAIGDVVIDGVVEQNGILRHNPDHLVQRGLRHIADVLPVNPDRPGIHLVKPEQQPPDGRFSRPRRPDQRNPLPRPDPDRNPLQDLAVGVIAKLDAVKHHLARRHLQRGRVWRIDNLGGLAQQTKHLAHIDQSLPDFAVNRAKETQRQRNLHHIGIDHHKIANSEPPRLHPDRRHHHDDDQPDGDDDILPDVQHRQRLPGPHRKTFVSRHRPVIAGGFPRLGVKILHRLIVQ